MSKNRLNDVAVAKFASLLLRHKPKKYEVTIDRNGFANLNDVLNIITAKKDIKREEILEILKRDQNRFVFKNDKIASRYGHSIDVMPTSKPTEPPTFLYHGTRHSLKQKIETEGLKPMRRKFVHLSKTIEDAKITGKRRDSEPLIIRVYAKEAYLEGTNFYDVGPIYLSEEIPGEFLAFDLK